MKGFGIVGALMLGLTVTAASGLAPKRGEVKGDLKTMQGAWIATKFNGREIDANSDSSLYRIEFEKDKARVTLEMNQAIHVYEYSVMLNEATSPKAMDLTVIKAPPEEHPRVVGETRPLIYKFEGDTLVISFGAGGRPDNFTPRPKTNHVVIHLKRVMK